MEIPEERQWRQEASWAVAIIIAAILLIIEFIGFFLTAEPPPEPPDRFQWWDYRQAERFIHIIWPVMMAGVISLLYYIVAFSRRKAVLPSAGIPPAVWNHWDVVKGGAGAFLVVVVVGTFAANFRYLLNLNVPEDALSLFLGTLILHGAMVGFALYFVRFKGGSFRALGFTSQKWFSNLLHGLIFYLAAYPVFFVITILWSLFLHVIGITPRQPPFIRMFEDIEVAWLKWGLIAMIAVIGPIAEEIFFRGFFYRASRRRYRPAIAILLNAAVFALIHRSIAAVVPIMFLGAVMAFLFERTNSLVSCSMVHIAHNSLQLVLLFNVVMM